MKQSSQLEYTLAFNVVTCWTVIETFHFSDMVSPCLDYCLSEIIKS